MKKWLRHLSILSVALVLFVTSGLPSRAAAQSAVDEALQKTLEQQEQVQLATEKLRPYVTLDEDVTFSLSVNERTLRKLGIAQETFKSVVTGMGLINEAVKTGELVTDSSGHVLFKNTMSPTIQSNEDSLTVYWWGIRWGLSNSSVQQILGLIAMGSGITGIAAALAGIFPGGQIASAVLWVLSGCLVVAGGWLAYLNAQGKGVYIHTKLTGSILWGTSQ